MSVGKSLRLRAGSGTSHALRERRDLTTPSGLVLGYYDMEA
jgi:hypothetical protein